MNRALVDRVVAAVLYEGYLLYPYRPSVKNRQRWTFGGLYPRAWSEAQGGADAWTMQTECLAVGREATRVTVTVRFLHLMARRVGELPRPLAEWPEGREPEYREVEALCVGERALHPWQEAVERTIDVGAFALGELAAAPARQPFAFPAHRGLEPVREAAGRFVGVCVREQQAVVGSVEVSAERAGATLFRVRVRILNETAPAGPERTEREEALLRSLVSTHTVLGVVGGAFVSLTDPPEACREAAAACRNEGAWPVLVGEPGANDTVLSSPIILPDYPQIAPESPGDLFDGTEIDEILTLRILTLTDEEKRAAAAVDERAHELLRRTEALAREQLMGLHGAVRGLRPVADGGRS